VVNLPANDAGTLTDILGNTQVGPLAHWKPKNEKDDLPCCDWIEFRRSAEPARSSASGTYDASSLRGFFHGATSGG